MDLPEDESELMSAIHYVYDDEWRLAKINTPDGHSIEFAYHFGGAAEPTLNDET